jgi:iron complex transport system ATP-binding protein
MNAETARLRSEDVTLAYDIGPVVHDVSLRVCDGAVTTIIGPNGCGKSTLLRSLARLLKPKGGSVLLDGQLIHRLPTREVAKRLGLLHQQTIIPEGITVEDLTRRGRYPHQSFLQPPSGHDADVVARALEVTGMTELRHRPVDQLSGGQRQRAWIAMALAQETPLLLLDEPTTFLDVAHQMEVIDLVRRLNREEGRTIVMVLHDVNEAARASDFIVAMRDGRVLREGTPEQILEPELLHELYGIDCDVLCDGGGGLVFVPSSGADCSSSCHYVAEAGGLSTRGLHVGYGKSLILRELSFSLPAGAITAIVGPNACGKSTLLRSIASLLKPQDGHVMLGDQDVHRGSRRRLARQLAILTQGPTPPSGFLVEDLVAAGRHPHQRLFHQWSQADEEAVEAALDCTNLQDLRFREVETLSGGQRQRAWVGMALAQDTPVLLLDEPTTFLDIAHQIELLDLVRRLNRDEGRTIVMVLHDLNMAARYADHIVAMKDGAVIAEGRPQDIVEPEMVARVFGIECSVLPQADGSAPLVVPIRAVGALIEPAPVEAMA